MIVPIVLSTFGRWDLVTEALRGAVKTSAVRVSGPVQPSSPDDACEPYMQLAEVMACDTAGWSRTVKKPQTQSWQGRPYCWPRIGRHVLHASLVAAINLQQEPVLYLLFVYSISSPNYLRKGGCALVTIASKGAI